MENQSAHFVFDGEKVVISPDPHSVISFLQEIEKESENFSEYERGWFYTLEEMRKIYEQEYNSEQKILRNTIYSRGKEWEGILGGKEVVIPQAFIDQTLVHLKEMLEKKTARFLFRLDAFHGHFFVPERIYEEHYASKEDHEVLRLLASDKDLGVIYHNSEHLKVDKSDKETVELHAGRNVIGWYDGRPMEILPLPTKIQRTAADSPEGMRDIGPFLLFAAHKNGEFVITADGKEIRLDISFDDGAYW